MASVPFEHDIDIRGIINLNQYELKKARIENLTSAPVSPAPVQGQLFFNSDSLIKKLGYFDGTNWIYPDETKVKSGGGILKTSGELELPNLQTEDAVVRQFAVDSKGRVKTIQVFSANHSEISDFDTGVRENRLNEMAVPNNTVNLNSQRISNLAAPLNDNDATNKVYVDNAVAGLKWKGSVKVATTGNIVLSGLSTIDTYPTQENDRVLVKDQTIKSKNGIWIAKSDAWVRAQYSDTWNSLVSAAVFVEQGATLKDTAWTCTADSGGTLETTDLEWTQFAGMAEYTASLGVQKIDNDFRAKFDSNSLELNGQDLRVKVDPAKAIERLSTGLATRVDGSTIIHSGNNLALHTDFRTKKYVGTITGNASATTFTVTHNLNTQDVQIEAKETSTNARCSLYWVITGVNTFNIVFNQAPANGKQYTIIVRS